MARFDVYRFGNKIAPLVVDVQADLLSALETRAVVPLIPEEKATNEWAYCLKPVFEIEEKRYIFMTTDIQTVFKDSLGHKVTNLENRHRQDIVAALDFLFQGF